MRGVSIIIVLLSCLAASAAGQSDTNVTAYWYDFKPSETNWDLYAAHVACADQDGHKPLEWRRKYAWTGFCGKVGPPWLKACGLCLKVTNRDQHRGKIVRIVDTCSRGPLILDRYTAFEPLDPNGNGTKIGHLIVDYEFVDCGDSI